MKNGELGGEGEWRERGNFLFGAACSTRLEEAGLPLFLLFLTDVATLTHFVAYSCLDDDSIIFMRESDMRDCGM